MRRSPSLSIILHLRLPDSQIKLRSSLRCSEIRTTSFYRGQFDQEFDCLFSSLVRRRSKCARTLRSSKIPILRKLLTLPGEGDIRDTVVRTWLALISIVKAAIQELGTSRARLSSGWRSVFVSTQVTRDVSQLRLPRSFVVFATPTKPVSALGAVGIQELTCARTSVYDCSRVTFCSNRPMRKKGDDALTRLIE